MENFINFFVEKGSEIVYTERRGLWSGMAPFSGCLKDTGFWDQQKGETCGGIGLWRGFRICGRTKFTAGWPFGAYRIERACRKEYTGVRKGYRRNEYDKNNACIEQ